MPTPARARARAAKVQSSTTEAPEERLEVRFDPDKMAFWPADAKRKTSTNRLKVTVLHYREAPSITPTGGKFTSRRFTVRTPDGKRWVGQTKNGTDIVRLRPDPRVTDE